jgi:hypothetical protein
VSGGAAAGGGGAAAALANRASQTEKASKGCLHGGISSHGHECNAFVALITITPPTRALDLGVAEDRMLQPCATPELLVV